MPFTLARSCYMQMIQHCLSTFPEEACGVLLANNASASITTSIRIANIHHHKINAFQFAPDQWVEAYYTAQQKGLNVVGFYHSHPTEDANPSPDDVQGFMDEQMLYAIISLKQKDSPKIKFYRLNGQNQFQNYPLVLT
jgi:proteasome lid subunit RPN8/RPN11